MARTHGREIKLQYFTRGLYAWSLEGQRPSEIPVSPSAIMYFVTEPRVLLV